MNKEKFKAGLKKHAVNTTASLVILTPLWAGVETYGFDVLREAVYSNDFLHNAFNTLHWNPEGLAMTESASKTARLLGIGTFYGGMGFVLNGGRRLSQKICQVKKESSEKIKGLHDTIYMGLIGGAMTPLYMWATEALSHQDIDTPTIVMASAISASIGFFGGPALGYAADMYEDFCGVKESERLPDKIRNLSRNKKLGLARLLTAASIGKTLAIYHFYHDVPIKEISQTIENIVGNI